MAILLNDNIYIEAGKPSEAKYLSTTNAKYATTTEAENAIPLSYRHPGLTVLVGDDEYWWIDDSLTILEIKTAGGLSALNDGEGTTWNAGTTALDWGGVITADVNITHASDGADFKFFTDGGVAFDNINNSAFFEWDPTNTHFRMGANNTISTNPTKGHAYVIGDDNVVDIDGSGFGGWAYIFAERGIIRYSGNASILGGYDNTIGTIDDSDHVSHRSIVLGGYQVAINGQNCIAWGNNQYANGRNDTTSPRSNGSVTPYNPDRGYASTRDNNMFFGTGRQNPWNKSSQIENANGTKHDSFYSYWLSTQYNSTTTLGFNPGIRSSYSGVLAGYDSQVQYGHNFSTMLGTKERQSVAASTTHVENFYVFDEDVTLSQFGQGNVTGTAAKTLAVTSTGKVIEISNAASFTLTDGEGTTANGTAVNLGGTISGNVTITGAGSETVTFNVNSFVADADFEFSGDMTVYAPVITDGAVTPIGLSYAADYTTNWDNTPTYDNFLVTKKYVDDATSTVTLNDGSGTTYDSGNAQVDLGGTLTKNATITGSTFTFNRLYSNVANMTIYEDASQFRSYYEIAASTDYGDVNHSGKTFTIDMIDSNGQYKDVITTSNRTVSYIVGTQTYSSTYYTSSGSVYVENNINDSADSSLNTRIAHEPNRLYFRVAGSTYQNSVEFGSTQHVLQQQSTSGGTSSQLQVKSNGQTIIQGTDSTNGYYIDLGLTYSSILFTNMAQFQFDSTDNRFYDEKATGIGIRYGDAYHDNWDNTSTYDWYLTPKAYVDELISGLGTWIDGSGTTFTDNGNGTQQYDLGGQMDADVNINNASGINSSYNFSIGGGLVDAPLFDLLGDTTGPNSSNPATLARVGVDKGAGGFYIETLADTISSTGNDNYLRLYAGTSATNTRIFKMSQDGFEFFPSTGGSNVVLYNPSGADYSIDGQFMTMYRFNLERDSGNNLSPGNNSGSCITVDSGSSINLGGVATADVDMILSSHDLSIEGQGAMFSITNGLLEATGQGDVGLVQTSNTAMSFSVNQLAGLYLGSYYEFDEATNSISLETNSSTSLLLRNSSSPGPFLSMEFDRTYMQLGNLSTANSVGCNIQFRASEGIVVSAGADGQQGIMQYADDYSAANASNSRWMTDKGYVDGGATTLGDMKYYDGSKWVQLPVGTIGQSLTLVNDGSGNPIPQWT